MESIDAYGRPFPKMDVLVPRTAADCVVIRNSNTKPEIMLITRKKPGKF